MAGALQIPDIFARSYKDFEQYPRNVLQHNSYPATLKAYAARLKDSASTLFVASDNGVHLPVREFANSTWEKLNILTEDKLKERLGDNSRWDLTRQTTAGAVATRRDPICRFLFPWAGGDSRNHLKITRSMFLRILSYHQVMANYLDFISVFGVQDEPRDLRFSGFREYITLGQSAKTIGIHALGRSGRQYQLCFNLKGVSQVPIPNKPGQKRWSIRQAAIHHQFDVEFGTTLWIITKGNKDLKERIEDMTAPPPYGRIEDQSFGTPEECFKSSLAVHSLLCNWSTEEWRWYIQYLEISIEEETQLAIHGPRGPGEAQLMYTTKHLQSVQSWQDKTNEVIMILETNADIMTSIRRFYERLLEDCDFELRTTCRERIQYFALQVENMIDDSRGQIARAKVLVQITEARKTLLLQHLQSQTTEKMEILTTSMHVIGAMSTREAIAMRVITVVTLIYLPATFVSTFFSTDIVKYQNQNGGSNTTVTSGPFMGSFSAVALMRWLQLTLPLTALTLGLGYSYYRFEERKKRHLTELPKFDTDSKSSLSG